MTHMRNLVTAAARRTTTRSSEEKPQCFVQHLRAGMLELTTERRTDTEDYVCAPSDLPRQVRPLHHAQTGCRFDFTFGLKPAEKTRNSTKKLVAP